MKFIIWPMSHVHVSFEIPEYVANTDGIGALRIL
jgi:GDPmannose 4,6-dehydratase